MKATAGHMDTGIGKTIFTGLVVAGLSLGLFGGHAHAQDNVIIIGDNTPCHANGVEYPAGSIITRGGKQYVCLDGAWELTMPALTGGGGFAESNPGSPTPPVKTFDASHAPAHSASLR